jgi:PR domain zinc finger protein 4
VTFVPDTPIESRARLSLPKQLVLRQSIVGTDVGKNLGRNHTIPSNLLYGTEL